MTWQERLKELEDQKQWEDAIYYMEDIISEFLYWTGWIECNSEWYFGLENIHG